MWKFHSRADSVARTILLCLITCLIARLVVAQSDDPIARDDAAYKKADAELNLAYKKALAKIMKEDARANLKEAERARIVYRDAEAEFRTSLGNRGGIVYADGRTVEQTVLTVERIKELQNLEKYGLRDDR
jgi:uncharacterized protein YecT (DUF1311 family)